MFVSNSDDFSPAYINHSGSESDMQLGATGYLGNSSAETNDGSTGVHELAKGDEDDDVFFSGEHTPAKKKQANPPDDYELTEEEAVKELDVMMASLSDLLSGMEDSDSEVELAQSEAAEVQSIWVLWQGGNLCLS